MQCLTTPSGLGSDVRADSRYSKLIQSRCQSPVLRDAESRMALSSIRQMAAAVRPRPATQQGASVVWWLPASGRSMPPQGQAKEVSLDADFEPLRTRSPS
jgi:hypothetical protein